MASVWSDFFLEIHPYVFPSFIFRKNCIRGNSLLVVYCVSHYIRVIYPGRGLSEAFSYLGLPNIGANVVWKKDITTDCLSVKISLSLWIFFFWNSALSAINSVTKQVCLKKCKTVVTGSVERDYHNTEDFWTTFPWIKQTWSIFFLRTNSVPFLSRNPGLVKWGFMVRDGCVLLNFLPTPPPPPPDPSTA